MSLLEDHLKWLNLHQEATLEPERPIVDPHHHFWPGEQHYLLEELWLDTHSGHNIKKTVFIEFMPPPKPNETRCKNLRFILLKIYISSL